MPIPKDVFDHPLRYVDFLQSSENVSQKYSKGELT